MSRRRKRLFRVLGVLVGTLIGVVLAELLGRFLDPEVFLQQRMRGGGLFVPYAPNTEADLLADEFRVRFSINRYGYRDRSERTEARVKDRQRVLLFGDSFSVGWGVEFEQTYGYLLEERLAVDVVNTSANGGCPLWYMVHAREAVPRFSPDLVLVQIYDNDPDDNWAQRERFGVANGQPLGELPEGLRPRGEVDLALSRFVRGLVVRRKLRTFFHWLRDEPPLARSPFVRPGSRADHVVLDRRAALTTFKVDTSPAAAFAFHDPARQDWGDRLALHRRLLDQFLRELQAAGVPVAVVYIPNSHLLRFRQPPEQLRAKNPHSVLLSEVCSARSVPFFDGVDLLSTAPDPLALYFAHDGHLNAAGHAHLAAALAEVLPQLLGQ